MIYLMKDLIKTATKSIFAICCFCLFSNGFSQELTYFTIGKKELININIYSLVQDKEETLFIGTNEGLFVYKKGTFIPIPFDGKQKGNSIFCLTQLDQRLFCCNMNGQIFELIDNTLKVIVEFPLEHLSEVSQLEMDRDGNLFFASNGVFKIEENTFQLLYKNERCSYHFLHKLPNGEIALSPEVRDSIIIFKNGSVQYQKVHFKTRAHDELNELPFHRIFHLNNQLIDFHYSKCSMEGSDTTFTLNSSVTDKLLQYSKNEIWVLNQQAGIKKIKSLNHPILKHAILKNLFVSAIEKGANNTLFLGTFGEGVIIVPSQQTFKHPIDVRNGKLRSIATDSSSVFLIDSKRGVIKYNGSSETILNNSIKTPNSNIFHTHSINYNLDKKHPSLFYEHPAYNDLINVKDVFKVTDSTVLVATSRGVYSYGQDFILDSLHWKKHFYGNHVYKFKAINERCKSVCYDQKYETVYVSTSNGLILIDKTGHYKEVLIKNKRIDCNDLEYYKGKLICATQKNGILFLDNGNLINQIVPKNGLGAINTLKIKINKGTLYVQNGANFQFLDLESFKLTTLGRAEGIYGFVTDFDVNETHLWLITDYKNVLSLSNSTKHTNFDKPALRLQIDSILVSGIKKKWSALHNLSHTENSLQVHFDLKSIKYRKETIINYRIKGLETNWNSVKAENNIIEYKSIPSGDYELEMFASFRNSAQSKPYIFPLVIALPYWRTWWFYASLVLLITSLFALLFLVRLKRIKKNQLDQLEKQTLKTNVLESELKALRSQMNPHFIFNSLNSIQDLVLKEDTDASYDYIVLFAKLVRSTLNYSNLDFIPIEKELEFLDIYLSLEKLRFAKNFEYSISYDGNTGIDIPSLLIQPFVENALVHGLMHKKGMKKVSVEFELGTHVICTITDNGIGRVRAKEINERQRGEHNSFAMEAIKQRLSLLNKQVGSQAGHYEIIDLYEEKEAIGTQVIITIPFVNHY